MTSRAERRAIRNQRAYRVGEHVGAVLAIIVMGTVYGGALALFALAVWSVLR